MALNFGFSACSGLRSTCVYFPASISSHTAGFCYQKCQPYSVHRQGESKQPTNLQMGISIYPNRVRIRYISLDIIPLTLSQLCQRYNLNRNLSCQLENAYKTALFPYPVAATRMVSFRSATRRKTDSIWLGRASRAPVISQIALLIRCFSLWISILRMRPG